MRLPIALAFALACLYAAPARAQYGPPQLRAEPLNWSFGAAVHNVRSEWQPYDYVVNRNRIYGEGSFAFNNNVEAFVRVGGSDFVVNDMHTYKKKMQRDISSDGYPAFLSSGGRFLAGEYGRWSLGGSVEGAVYAAQERFIRWNYDVYQELHFENTLELNVDLSVGCQLGRHILYGGPLLHYATTKVDVRTNKFGPNWEIEDTLQAVTLGDKAGFGGFFGWSAPLGESGWTLQLEGAGVRGGMGGSAAIFKRF